MQIHKLQSLTISRKSVNIFYFKTFEISKNKGYHVCFVFCDGSGTTILTQKKKVENKKLIK